MTAYQELAVSGTAFDDEEEERGPRWGDKTRRAEMEDKIRQLSMKTGYLRCALSIPGAFDLGKWMTLRRGILLQLFGGTNKSIARGGGGGGPKVPRGH